MAQKLLVNKDSILAGLKAVHENSSTFNTEEYNFLVTLLENLESLQKDASRYRTWKELLDDRKLSEEIETILDKYINKV